MGSRIRTVNLKEGRPGVQEARARLNAEIERAGGSGPAVLKVIHGYGSSGFGGSLRDSIRRSLRKRLKEGKIRSFVAGEQWSVFDDAARQMIEECPELQRDADLNGYNEGVTFVLV